MPVLKLPNDLGPTVPVESFDAAKHPEFAGEMAGSLDGLQRAAAVLTNLTGKDIAGIAVEYTLIDQTGRDGGANYRTDSYMVGAYRPVLRPQQKILIAPGVFLPSSLASRPRIGPGGSAGIVRIISDAVAMEAQIDVVLLADGTVLGPNKLNYPAEITARNAAARLLAANVEDTIAKGGDVQALLSAYGRTPVVRGDFIGMWAHRFADQLSRHNGLSVESLKRMAEPPVFRPAGH